MILNESYIMDGNPSGADDRSAMMRTDPRNRETLVESVMRSKKELSRPVLLRIQRSYKKDAC